MERLQFNSVPETRQIAPPEKLELLPEKEGHIKVKLTFHTHEPKHIRSILLLEQYNINPPFNEDVYVLMPCMEVFPRLEAFIPGFEKLKQARVLPDTVFLKDFKIVDEDILTLAYII